MAGEHPTPEENKNKRTRSGSFVLWCLGAASLIAVDQIAKWYAFAHVPSAPTVRRVGLLLHENVGFAFSLRLPDALSNVLYLAAALGIIHYLVQKFWKLPPPAHAAWALVVAGGVSNLAERMVRGSVRDFIYVFTGVFNLADFMIIAGVVLLLLVDQRHGERP